MCHGGERLAERDSSSESIVGKITEDRRNLGLEKARKAEIGIESGSPLPVSRRAQGRARRRAYHSRSRVRSKFPRLQVRI